MILNVRWIFVGSLALAILMLFGSADAVHAETVTITNGFVSIGGAPFSPEAWEGISFNFSGNGFSAAGGGGSISRQGIMSPCAFDLCQPGTTIFPNSTIFLAGVGSATFNGTTIGAWWFGRDSVLSFTGPGVVIPNSTDLRITLTSPFVMSGSVIVHSLDDDEHPPVFSTMISGSGIATMTLNYFPHLGPGGYVYSNVRYDFQPVPEPASILLLSLGLGSATAYCKRRHRSKK